MLTHRIFIYSFNAMQSETPFSHQEKIFSFSIQLWDNLFNYDLSQHNGKFLEEGLLIWKGCSFTLTGWIGNFIKARYLTREEFFDGILFKITWSNHPSMNNSQERAFWRATLNHWLPISFLLLILVGTDWFTRKGQLIYCFTIYAFRSVSAYLTSLSSTGRKSWEGFRLQMESSYLIHGKLSVLRWKYIRYGNLVKSYYS